MTSTSKFFELPEELLTAVTKELMTENNHCVTDLKALRLGSPRFAYLDIVQKSLFGGIQFLATSEHLEHLVHADLCRIAPFVRTVTFAAPFSSWSLTFEEFREVIISQAIQKYKDIHRPPAPKYDSWNNDEYFIEHTWMGESPLSTDEVRAGYKQYQENARATQLFMRGAKLREMWTGALRALPHVHNFRFTTAECENPGSWHLPVRPDCVVRPHRLDMVTYTLKEVSRRAAAPVGDALFAAAIASLSKANVEIHTFDVVCRMTGQFGWETLPGWDELDLSQLPTFTFQTKVEIRTGLSMEYPEHQLEVTARAADAIAAVSKKSKDRLEYLKIENSVLGPMRWPGYEIIPLSRLRVLALGNICIRARQLAAWMAQMPLLEVFKLRGTMLHDLPNDDWLFVFDAIRNHPQALEIDFWHTIENECFETVCVKYRTDKVEDWLALPEEEKSYDYVHSDPDWPLYLSGKIGYNAFMQDWFRDHY
ncbi:MAG: hypothetical protein M1812_002975 [Candelaria pacifica]|nr:MAG: hypothetical protein M1812_002975 [Candelaria pacifica]